MRNIFYSQMVIFLFMLISCSNNNEGATNQIEFSIDSDDSIEQSSVFVMLQGEWSLHKLLYIFKTDTSDLSLDYLNAQFKYTLDSNYIEFYPDQNAIYQGTFKLNRLNNQIIYTEFQNHAGPASELPQGSYKREIIKLKGKSLILKEKVIGNGGKAHYKIFFLKKNLNNVL